MNYPTCFSEIIGNEEVKKQLQDMISKKAIGHALLFSGIDGIGKSLFARVLGAQTMAEYPNNGEHFSKIRTGQHPDIHIYRPEGKLGLHSLESLRKLSEEIYYPPYEASWKVFIVHDAERMLSYSANALLKTFEEPPPRTLIILLCRSQSTLLPTILSRCCIVSFKPIPSVLIEQFLQQRYTLEKQKCHRIAYQAQGSLGRAIKFVEQGEETLRIYLLHFLAKGVVSDYRVLQDTVRVLNEQMENLKKQTEETAREEFSRIYLEQISAQQQHILGKEIEGLIALSLHQEAQILFEYILSWYRDLSLLLVGGNPTYLVNIDFHQELEQCVQRGNFKALDQVYGFVEEAYLALQRSTPFPLCLENLLLKLS